MKEVLTSLKKLSLSIKMIVGVIITGLIAAIIAIGMEFVYSKYFCEKCRKMNKYYNSLLLNSPQGTKNNKPIHDCIPCHVKPLFINFINAKVRGIFPLLWHISGHTHVEYTPSIICVKEGCHNIKKVDATTSAKASTLHFNHKVHIEIMNKIGTRYQCMPCHKEVAHGALNYMPDMKENCFICHTGKNTSNQNCISCHPKHLQIKGRIPDLYPIHQKKNLACIDCHLNVHRAGKINCLSCHKDESILEGIHFEVVKESR
ncbi:MAG: NapC/NirT family cytochrome c [bacterium]